MATETERVDKLVEESSYVFKATVTQLSASNEPAVRPGPGLDEVPGLSFTPSDTGAPMLAIRGITTGGDAGTTVGIVVDDVPYYGPLAYATQAPDIDPSDLARVEVLRGPQGRLYGASSMGGLLKYVTVDPSTDAVSGRIQAGTSSVFNGAGLGYVVRGSVNLPLGDTFADGVLRPNRFERLRGRTPFNSTAAAMWLVAKARARGH